MMNGNPKTFQGKYRPQHLEAMRQDSMRRSAYGQAYDAVDQMLAPDQRGNTYNMGQLLSLYPELSTVPHGDRATQLRELMASDWVASKWDQGWRGVNATGKSQGQRGFSFSGQGGGGTSFGRGSNDSAFKTPKGIFAGRNY